MNNSEIFNEDYYINGLATGKSNYENYRWMPDLTFPLAFNIVEYLQIKKTDSILDFGCARGYVVKALRMLGFECFGFDISEWAIKNCDDTVKTYLSNLATSKTYDFIFSKDVFEHIPEEELKIVMTQLLEKAHKKIFIVVPLTNVTNGKYICPKDELDVTHIIRWTSGGWYHFIKNISPKFHVCIETSLPQIKPMSEKFPDSYGFITLTRI